MIGYHSVDMIAEAYLDGFRGFNARTGISGDARHGHAGSERI